MDKQKKGYTSTFIKDGLKESLTIQKEDITQAFDRYVKNAKKVYIIIGDVKKINTKSLNKLGQVKRINAKKLFFK